MHKSFSDIGQFKNVVKGIRSAYQFVGLDKDGEPIVDRNAVPPVITFTGTVKLHGTNAGFAMDKDGNTWVQSRTNVITPEKDNAGFAFFCESRKDTLCKFIIDIKDKLNLTDETVIIYGEWCGGNIQKGVAINGLDKMFIIFAVKIATSEDSNYYLKTPIWSMYKDPDNNIYNINDYETYTIDIDFANLEEAQNKLVEITEAVEKECPVGKAFGVSGVGEGVVWVGWYKDMRCVFKVKGEKHSSSKVNTLASVDTEKVNSIKEFVEYAVTESRLNQAIEQVFTTTSRVPDKRYTGDFLRWMVNDVIKEELDTMVENNLEPNDVNKYISEASRKWFFQKVDTLCD